jgi:hypothetical protein
LRRTLPIWWLGWIILGGLAFAGYMGPWLPHRAAGLIILGIDLGEYVKFLTPAPAQSIAGVRQIFYLPLFALSLSAELLASRVEFPRLVRLLLALAGIPLALCILPPAWTPKLLLTPEFRLQTATIALCLLGLPAQTLLHRVSDRWIYRVIAAVCVAAALAPVWGFLQILPAISDLYRQPLQPGWGMWVALGAQLALAGEAVVHLATSERP